MTRLTKGTSARREIQRQRGPLNALVADRMRALGLRNVVSFAEYVGISDSAMYDLLNGRVVNGQVIMPKWQLITKLAQALDKPTHELLYILDPDAPGAETTPDIHQVPVPIAGEAGVGAHGLHKRDDVVYVERQFAEGRDLVAFTVIGDSMAGGRHPIHDGDVVIVDRALAGQLNSSVVARLHDDGYVVKRLRPGNVLDSANPDCVDLDTAIITTDRIDQMVGQVVRVVSDLVA